MEPSQEPATAIVFRPSKKRKAYRQRAGDSPPPPIPPKDTPTREQPSSQDEQENGAESAVTAAMRVRNARRARLRGVGFSSDDHDAPAPNAPTDHLDRAPPKGIPDRFTHQTGLVATLNDRHMYVAQSPARAPAAAAAAALGGRHPQKLIIQGTNT